MCNPRRIRVTATRQVNQAWEHEVTRAVQLQGLVSGQARALQQLGPTVGVPALQAMQQLLSEGVPGWERSAAGYRHDVEGGHVVYDPAAQTIEIVAECEASVTATGAHTEALSGLLRTEASQTADGQFYDDGWRGLTREVGEKKAQEDAERKLDKEQQRLLREATEDAEQQAAGNVEAIARQEAEERLAQAEAERREQLAADARASLRQVGMRARQAFHQLLARGYQDAILEYAQAHGAIITCNDDQGDTIDIEFRMSA